MAEFSPKTHPDNKSKHARMVLRVALFYVLFASFWILISDSVVSWLVDDPEVLTQVQTIKGWLFVAVTGGLLYAYLSRCLAKLREAEQSSEEQARQQFAQLARLFDSFNAIIYVSDMETHELLFVNRYATELFGDDWRHKSCYQYLQEDVDMPCGFCTNPKLRKQGETGPATIWEFQNTKNQRWYECLDKAIRWSDGRLVRLEIALDITERKELEQTKDELLSAVSHEMRTPLTAITGFAELLLDNPEVPDEINNHLQVIYRESEKMLDLVNTFLDLRRFKTNRARVNYEKLAVESIINSALKSCRDCNTTHDIKVSGVSDCRVFGNRKELTQAINQLVANACRFSPEGGPVTIHCERNGDRNVVIGITDRGIGIPHEQQGHVFENFFRIDRGDTRRVGGVGLGLALVKDIIELHGGQIWLESEPGQGSTFFVALPEAQITADDSGTEADSRADSHV